MVNAPKGLNQIILRKVGDLIVGFFSKLLSLPKRVILAKKHLFQICCQISSKLSEEIILGDDYDMSFFEYKRNYF